MARVAASIVLCTRDRATRLRACLEAIAAIRCPEPWELVVVDNGSTDGTASVVEEARASIPVALLVLQEPVPGIARARNRGWRAASGEIAVFTDDDCYPADDLLVRYLARFDEAPELGFAAGSVLLHDPGDARLGTVTRRDLWRIRPGAFVTPGQILTANVAFRRSVLEELGGLDEAFAYGPGPGGSDVDLVVRATAAGWEGLYDPEIVVRHHHGRRAGSQDVRAARRSYDVGRGMFYAKCALDRRLRRTYVQGWLVLTWGRLRRGESLRPFLRELRGALLYLRLRRRARV